MLKLSECSPNARKESCPSFEVADWKVLPRKHTWLLEILNNWIKKKNILASFRHVFSIHILILTQWKADSISKITSYKCPWWKISMNKSIRRFRIFPITENILQIPGSLRLMQTVANQQLMYLSIFSLYWFFCYYDFHLMWCFWFCCLIFRFVAVY